MPVSNRLVNSFDYLCFIRIISVNIGDELFQSLSRPAFTFVEVLVLLMCPHIYMFVYQKMTSTN